ncbi:MAG: molybdopterin dinucleotide binding domain-containing protein [Candidatus Thorarchaeota archaeon]|nr:MAG: tRNA CCA-pyrophosphorylase [Candidatus Thorarchaeota archaeon]
MARTGVEVLLISGRTLRQGRGLEVGKLSPDYFDAVSVCELDETAMSVLGVTDGDPVLVETIEGSVVLHARLGRGLEPGTAFVPAGPYANAVIPADTWESGMPDFKGVRAMVFSASGQKVPSVSEFLAQMMEDAP